MPKVICTLPNASTDINGVFFWPAEGGMLSAELSDEQAAAFLSIPGYVAHKEDPAADARRKAEIAAAAQREADEAAAKAAAALKAVAPPAATVKPVVPVAPAKTVKPAAKADGATDDDTTF